MIIILRLRFKKKMITCPITLAEIQEPVISSVDGYTYEKSAILAWLSTNKISPMTKQPMTESDLIPNRALFKYDTITPQLSNERKEFKVYRNSDATWIKVVPPEPTVRFPVNIMFVIDTSGSMGLTDNTSSEQSLVTRLDLVVHSAITIINMLNENDSLGIISFNHSSTLCFSPTKMTVTNKELAKNTLYNLEANGRTYIWDGIRLALETVSDNYNVIVLTDGESDVEPPRGTLNMFKSAKFTSTFHFFGYGYKLDLPLLKNLAMFSGGWFAFVPDASIVGSTFVNFISHILSCAGNSIVVNKNIRKGSVLFEKSKYIYNQDRIHSINIDGVDYEILLKEDEFSGDYQDNQTFISLVRSKNLTSLTPWAKERPTFTQAIFETPDNPDGTGQIYKAFKLEYAKVWGNIYIETMMIALDTQYCPNFKDSFLFQFGDTDVFRTYQSEAEDKFLNMQIRIKNNMYSSHAQPQTVQSTSYYNLSGG